MTLYFADEARPNQLSSSFFVIFPVNLVENKNVIYFKARDTSRLSELYTIYSGIYSQGLLAYMLDIEGTSEYSRPNLRLWQVSLPGRSEQLQLYTDLKNEEWFWAQIWGA